MSERYNGLVIEVGSRKIAFCTVDWLDHGVAIDAGAGGINQLLHLMPPAGLQHVEGPANVHLERRLRILMAVQQPQRRQMHHAVDPFHRFVQHIPLEHIPAVGKYSNSRIAQRVGEVAGIAADHVVIDQDFFDIGEDEFIDDMAADQAGATDDKDAFIG